MRPVTHLEVYMKASSGSLFCHLNGSAVSRSQFIDILNRSLKFIDLSPNKYKGHSLRGALSKGKSDA